MRREVGKSRSSPFVVAGIVEDFGAMACNGNNHADNCQCNFGKGGRPTIRSFVWKGWRPKSVRGYFTGPNATCPECRKAVFYIPFKAGGGAYFDTFGPPWPKHPCTNNPPQYSPYTISGKPKLRSLPTTLEKDGWFPFIARNVERLASGTIVHGVGLENPTTFHLGALIDLMIDSTRPIFVRLLPDNRAQMDFFPTDRTEPSTVDVFPDCLNDLDLLLLRTQKL